MILQSLALSVSQFESLTGWAVKSEGACKDDRCVPLADVSRDPLDVEAVLDRLGMPVVRDDVNGLYAVGPESGGRALTSAVAPDFELPDWQGRPFKLSGLRGRKVLLACWASW